MLSWSDLIENPFLIESRAEWGFNENVVIVPYMCLHLLSWCLEFKLQRGLMKQAANDFSLSLHGSCLHCQLNINHTFFRSIFIDFEFFVLSWRLKELFEEVQRAVSRVFFAHSSTIARKSIVQEKKSWFRICCSTFFFFCFIRINRRKYTQLCHDLNFSLARSFISINFVDMERSRWIHLGIEKLDWNWIEKRECLTMIRQIFPCVLCNSFVRLQLFYVHS